MKSNLSKIILVFVVVLLGQSCVRPIIGIRGEGEIISKNIDIPQITGVLLSVDAEVVIISGDNQEIVIEAQENILENIELKVDDGIWEIGYDKNVKEHDGVKIYVTIPTLDRIYSTGTGNIICNSDFIGEDLDVAINGTGDIFCNSFLEYNGVTIEITGTGSIDIYGSFMNCQSRVTGTGNIFIEGISNNLSISSTGTGHFNGIDFETNNTEIISTGSGDCTVFVNENFDITISGTGDVYYKGFPSMNSQITGTGRIISLN